VSAALSDLSTLWRSRGLSVERLTLESDGTLAASERSRVAHDVTLLVEVATDGGGIPLSPERLEFGARLGAGGMGEVRLALQRSLRRDVAVKTVLDPVTESGRAALLKEAWVGAALEHPNVIPVHTLASTTEGDAVVMKRVEGVSLTTIIADPSAHERFRLDPLEAQLRALVSVCRAMELAHQRGILHLDLKPDNVMVGAFGEVYLLDWGLAAALAHGPEWLSRGSAIDTIAGTPAYMAPELASADGAHIDERTDVYLLGGILHTMVTKAPLHGGTGLMMTLLASFTSEPKTYAADVPEELVSILHRATHRDPRQRFESARAFREALEGFLRHRRADRLVRRALEGARELRGLLDAGAGDAEVEPRFSEHALALEEARRGWAEHPQLRPLTDTLLAHRATHAIAQDRPEAALAFLGEMRAAPRVLVERAEAARRSGEAREAHVRRLEAMSRELDITLGSSDRRRLFVVLGALWLGFSVCFGWLLRSGALTMGYRELLAFGGVLVGTLGPVAFWIRRRLFQNTANRRLYAGLTFTAAVIELHWIACMLLDVAPSVAIALTPLYYAYAFATLALALDRRFFYGAGALAVAALAGALVPEAAHEVVGVGGASAVALTLWAWSRSSDES
jgi:serine/threonine-protein kinase